MTRVRLAQLLERRQADIITAIRYALRDQGLEEQCDANALCRALLKNLSTSTGTWLTVPDNFVEVTK